jgi:hypothetical protein
MNGRFILQAIISVLVVGATIGMIFTKATIPEWWPPLAVAIVGYLFGVSNGNLRPRL